MIERNRIDEWWRRKKRSLVSCERLLRTRPTFSQSPWCLSAYRSWAAQTSSSSTRALRSMALTTAKTATPRDARGIGGIFRLSTGQRPSTPARDTVRLVLCCYRIFSQRTALTLIRLITGSGALSNSECTSRGCTTLTNWNNVYSKRGVTSTRLTMHWRVTLVFSCMRAGERRTLGAYAVENNTPITSQPYNNINVSFLSNTTRFLIFSVVICNKFELLNFPR